VGEPLGPFGTELDNMLLQEGRDERVHAFSPCRIGPSRFSISRFCPSFRRVPSGHADTQGQSTAIVGLAYLLGIHLMPRTQHWKDLTLYRPSSLDRYTHIDTLFREQVDRELIRTMLPDMLRIGLSIRAGKIMPSTILTAAHNGLKPRWGWPAPCGTVACRLSPAVRCPRLAGTVAAVVVRGGGMS